MTMTKRFVAALAAMVLVLSLTVSVGAAQPLKTYTLPLKEMTDRVSEKVEPGRVSFTSYYNIGAVDYQDMKTAGNRAVRIGGKIFFSFDTLTGRAVTGRMTVNPLLIGATKGDLCTIVDVSAETNQAVKDIFEKLLKKPVAVMYCGQKGDLGMTVVVSGDLDVSKLDKNNLMAYAYNPDTNSYIAIKDAKCVVDEKGFVHVQTQRGGYIVVANSK